VTNVNDGIATLQLNQFAVQPAASKGRGAASTSAVEVTGTCIWPVPLTKLGSALVSPKTRARREWRALFFANPFSQDSARAQNEHARSFSSTGEFMR
jgi:hypothetical protein